MRFLSLSLMFAVSATSAPSQAHDEAQKLFATPPVQHGSFGAWVSADSGTMVVGANGYAVGAGRLAVVFERVGGIWQQVDELSITNLVAGYVTPVAVDGTTVMLGDFGGEAVHVFERIGGVWTPTQVLSASQPLPEAHFGRRIVIDGDRAAIAAPMDAATELRGGAVYIFERTAGSWTEVEKLTAAPAHWFGFYGLGLDLEGDVLAVGEHFYYSGLGLAYVYRRGPTGWALQARLIGGGSSFGRALSLENGVLAVGDYEDYTDGTGAVRLFEEAVGWEGTGIVTAADAGAGYGFGDQVLLHEGRLIVGSASPELGLGEGVYIFESTGTDWVLSATLAPHGGGGGTFGSLFGCSLAADGGDLFVGSAGDSAQLQDSGAVYAYEEAPGTSYCSSTSNSSGAPAKLTTSGTPSVAANDLALRAQPVAQNQNGLVFYGPDQVMTPFGNGFLCVGAGSTGIARLALTGTGPNGVIACDLDITMPPTGMTQITPGSTWNFQAWFTDPLAGGMAVNLSDARSVTFHP